MNRRESFRTFPPRLLPAGIALITLTLMSSLVACAKTEAPAGEQPATTAEVPPAAESAEQGFAPVTSRQGSGELSDNKVNAPGAVFALPANWRSETPSSTMRLAQAAIPGAGGDAQMTVFHFGPGGGGGVEANLQRWIGQMEVAGGAEAARQELMVGDFKITWVHVDGTLKAGTMGVGNTAPQPDSTLLGAVVEGDQGPWFFKVLGPTATLKDQRDNFLAMLKSVQRP